MWSVADALCPMQHLVLVEKVDVVVGAVGVPGDAGVGADRSQILRTKTPLNDNNESSLSVDPACRVYFLKLENIPHVLENVFGFDLSHNNISQIKDIDFIKYVKLRRLLLQSNRIQSIADQAFQINTDLEYLDLSDNLLTQLSPNWFKHLSKLQYLKILGNSYSDLGSGRIFSNLTRLRWLEFGNPSLALLKEDDFVGITHLEEFILTANNLHLYQKGSFSFFRNVSHVALSLNYTFLNESGQAQQILVDLSGSTTHLELRDFTFPDKSDSRIFSVPGNSSLRKFTFRNTLLTDNTAITFINGMKNMTLSELVVKDCVLSGTGKWPKVDYIKSNLLHSLTLNNISIKHFYKFYKLSSIGPLLEPIKTATFTKLNMFLMPCAVSRRLRSVEYLDLSHNLLRDTIMREMVCPEAWPSLRYLILRKNILRSLSTTSRKLSTRVPLNVEVLDLSNNDISSFAVNLPSLKELNVSNNKFKHLPGDSYLPKMEVLTISNNKLISLTGEEIMLFKKLESLEAGNNNYICSCEFLFYMNHHITVQLLDRPENYVCDSPLTLRGMLVQNTKRSFFDCHTTLSVVLLCGGMSLAAAVVGMMCYKYHGIWYIQMTWAWLQVKRKPKKVRNNDICYDAFVSYSEMDSEWVETFLIRELESVHPPLTLCLHKRDFIPGKWIIDNIIESIEKSRKTLFVLSQHFVQSEWCKYELDYTHFRLFDENNDTAILVLLEAIPKETIPQRFCKLRKLMNTKTYLEWPQDEIEQQIFWFNLKIALKGDDNASGPLQTLPELQQQCYTAWSHPLT
uniref:toll-like receptor 2 n=1 Tax=Pristiophorus japonicus TaxID=55135 RepID=UPI00398F7707